MTIKVRLSTIDDCSNIFDLYRVVAARPGGLARLSNEISENYVNDFVEKTINDGVGFIAQNDKGLLIGEIHAYKSDIYCFSHILSNLTIAIAPDYQGKGIGKKLFEALLKEIENSHFEIERIELIVRESNFIAINFYKSLGFVIEGKLINRIKNVDGSFEADIPMAWHRNK